MNRPLAAMLADALDGRRVLSSTELASALGLPLKSLHRHTKRWRRAGVLRRLGGRWGRRTFWCAGPAKPAPIGPPRSALAALAGGPVSAAEAAGLLGVIPSKALRSLTRLEHTGYASRIGGAWGLTPAGARYVRRVLGVRCWCRITVEAA